jgi:hypothetical protein
MPGHRINIENIWLKVEYWTSVLGIWNRIAGYQLWRSLSYCSENSCLIAQQLLELYVKFVSKRNMKLDNAVWHLFLRPPGESRK